jgi:hypothetical protein
MFNNIIIVCSHFIKFNGNVFNFDRGGSAYSVHFTSDGLHMLVCVKNPHSINIANLKTSEVHIIRGLEEIFQFKILAFSMRP